ncbi:hypothetical protein ACFVWR_04465 [Leifsonia sp. NPDC058292]|uniref:hypothetical protein n=1 Tax=Leifsonia sp. NPDC058292 TaxID=3346428 RepID=UPI0036DCA52E
MIVPNVITQGQYLPNILGVILFLLIATVMSSLPVEFTYLAYLKSRDKRYWEKQPPMRVATKQQRAAVFKKVGKWVLIVLAVLVALLIMTKTSG